MHFFAAAAAMLVFCILETSNFIKKNFVSCFKDLLLHKFQNPTLSGARVAPASCYTTMLVLLMLKNEHLQWRSGLW
jgi:hypothetical protein